MGLIWLYLCYQLIPYISEMTIFVSINMITCHKEYGSLSFDPFQLCWKISLIQLFCWCQINHIFNYIHEVTVIGPLMQLYSETTWAVGIAQLTHHEVQSGGKNPETGGRGILAPTADRVVS